MNLLHMKYAVEVARVGSVGKAIGNLVDCTAQSQPFNQGAGIRPWHIYF